MIKYDIGFLGGGQLARMSIQAAQRMGFRCLSLDPGLDTPASQVGDSIVGSLVDSDKIAELAKQCLRVTLENEFIPANAIRQAFTDSAIDEGSLIPGIDCLATIQDKLIQRQALLKAGVPSPKAISLLDRKTAIAQIGFPMVIKSRFGGYDGKGTRYAKTESELEEHRSLWTGAGWLAEQFVPFRRELAVMVFIDAHSRGAFPTMETIQTKHVCDLVFPGGVDASEVAIAAVEAVGGKGLFGVELFELESGEFLINEIAPRPHNTGHYSLDWGGVSQFEQHVRLTMGLPLGSPEGRETCMANLLGQEGASNLAHARARALEDPGVHVHWYGKAEAKLGRKMGHLNVVGGENLVERARNARANFYEGWKGAD
ncbi:MAG: ATP-grasp domain-containing protein [Chlorobia bacterium]|nr:ATP-grasp domain-containing protein [Fimbriimonadaceae bacterium]